MTDSTAYMITDMLRSVVRSGTGTSANVASLDVAGKRVRQTTHQNN